MRRCHGHIAAGLIEKDQPFPVDLRDVLGELITLFLDFSLKALHGGKGLFFRVRPALRSVRCIDDALTETLNRRNHWSQRSGIN